MFMYAGWAVNQNLNLEPVQTSDNRQNTEFSLWEISPHQLMGGHEKPTIPTDKKGDKQCA